METRGDRWLRRTALTITVVTLLGVGAFIKALAQLPSRVGILEQHDAEFQRLKIPMNIRVVRAQNDWIIKYLAKREKIEPPDFSRFDPGVNDARRD